MRCGAADSHCAPPPVVVLFMDCCVVCMKAHESRRSVLTGVAWLVQWRRFVQEARDDDKQLGVTGADAWSVPRASSDYPFFM